MVKEIDKYCLRQRLGLSLSCAIIIAFLLSGCTATRYLKDGEVFYTGAELNFETPQGFVGRKKILEKELQTYIRPEPNKKFLGSRPGVWFYYSAGTPKKEKGGLRNFMRNKLGQPPVFLKDATPDRTAKTLEGQIRNEGYFKSTVSAEVKIKGKTGKVIYNIVLLKPYHLRNIQYPKGRDSTYAQILKTLYEESLLDSTQRYDLEKLKAEQERIEKEVENHGFYYFDNRYLLFEADSTVGDKQVDLQLKLEPNIPNRARRIYRLNEVNVFPNYILTTDTLNVEQNETIKIDGFNYIDNKHSFRPEIITRVINLRRGEIYSREAHDLTLIHLMGLGAFKFVNIKFTEAPRADSSMLNTHIYLTPLKKKSLRAEVQLVSKSNNFVGPGISLSFLNRNFLRGAELFQLKIHTAYEVQYGRQTTGALNALEAGLELSLTVPRFIAPFKIDYNLNRYLPKTQFRVGFNVQNRLNYFLLNSANVGYSYNWRQTNIHTHELFPIDISFVQTNKTSAEFDSLLSVNPVLASSFEDQFIVGTRYTYTLNTQVKENPFQKFEEEKINSHNFYINATVDLAGNIIHTVQKQFSAEGGGEPYQIFNQPYSQFARGEIDARHYWQFDKRNKLVSRLLLGTGYAFGNSTTMPYIKQFSIGGSNSIRAFPARSIGPGTYNVRTETSLANDTRLFIDQRGDIKIEANVEFRFDIIKSLKGAVFVDGGNIWLIRYDSTRTGGQFDKNKFLKEFAVGTGLGLRLDFSVFVLRLDIAFPIRKPYLPEGERWVFSEIDLRSSQWRKENLMFNIAIGYPF